MLLLLLLLLPFKNVEVTTSPNPDPKNSVGGSTTPAAKKPEVDANGLVISEVKLRYMSEVLLFHELTFHDGNDGKDDDAAAEVAPNGESAITTWDNLSLLLLLPGGQDQSLLLPPSCGDDGSFRSQPAGEPDILTNHGSGA